MMPCKKILAGSCIVAGFFILTACTSHKVEIQPLEIKPIHITIDVNVKVDRALDDFFGDLDNIKK